MPAKGGFVSSTGGIISAQPRRLAHGSLGPFLKAIRRIDSRIDPTKWRDGQSLYHPIRQGRSSGHRLMLRVLREGDPLFEGNNGGV